MRKLKDNNQLNKFLPNRYVTCQYKINISILKYFLLILSHKNTEQHYKILFLYI